MEFSKIELYTEEKEKLGIIKYMLPLSADFPKFKELEEIYDGGKHENIILIPHSINEGLATAARILNSCLGDIMAQDGADDGGYSADDIKTMLEDIDDAEDINSIFYEADEDNEDKRQEEQGLPENAFKIYMESQISADCNNIGADVSNWRTKDKPLYDISGYSKMIIVCDGLFALSDKLIEQLKRTTGNVIVIVPKNKANTEKVNDLIFEGFRCFEIPARTKQYYADLLMRYLDSLGYVCFADTVAVISNLMGYRNNRFREYDVKLICDRAVERAGILQVVDDSHFSIDAYRPDKTSSEEMLKEIIGLEKAKEMIKMECAIALQNKRMAELTGACDSSFKSICFKGSSGTGKTSMARAVSKIYAEAGVTNGVFVEVSRSDFVSPWIGETSLKVKKIFEQADGGVIFIDEAGTIANNADDRGGVDALGAIVRHMDNNPQTVVIFATYDAEMERLFEINQGLKSRISNIIPFEGYDTEQLVAIFKLMATGKGYTLAPGYKKVIEPYFDKVKESDSFGNGRDVRKLLGAAIGIMASQSKSFSTKIPLSAIRQAVKEALENQTETKNPIGFRQVPVLLGQD